MQLQFYLMICVIHLERTGSRSPTLDPWLSSQGKRTATRTYLISETCLSLKYPEAAFGLRMAGRGPLTLTGSLAVHPEGMRK